MAKNSLPGDVGYSGQLVPLALFTAGRWLPFTRTSFEKVDERRGQNSPVRGRVSNLAMAWSVTVVNISLQPPDGFAKIGRVLYAQDACRSASVLPCSSEDTEGDVQSETFGNLAVCRIGHRHGMVLGTNGDATPQKRGSYLSISRYGCMPQRLFHCA